MEAINYNTHIFDIPIYRLSFNDYVKERNSQEAKYIERQLQYSSLEMNEEQLEAECNYHSNCWYHQFFWCWKYNEVIGWISLYITISQIRGDLYMAKGERFSGRSKKQFELRETIIKCEVTKFDTDNDIYKELLEELRDTQKENWMRNYVLDIGPFLAIGPHVKWRDVIFAANRQHT